MRKSCRWTFWLTPTVLFAKRDPISVYIDISEILVDSNAQASLCRYIDMQYEIWIACFADNLIAFSRAYLSEAVTLEAIHNSLAYSEPHCVTRGVTASLSLAKRARVFSRSRLVLGGGVSRVCGRVLYHQGT